MTFQDRIDQANGHPTGFDALRVILAVAVICIHSVSVSYGLAADLQLNWTGPLRGLTSLVLPLFFALSGFLVAGSLERTPQLHKFLTLRAVRIVPALAVETLLCAIILGPLLTTWALSDYFSSPTFFAYFRNIIGDVHYFLPGVFENSPARPIVNISLWTVPFELECYLALAFLGLITLSRRPVLFAACVLGLCALTPLVQLAMHEPQTFLRPRGRFLVAAFLCGIVVYQWRRRIPHDPLLALASTGIAVLLLMHSNLHFWAAPFAAYTVAYLGLLKAPPLPIFKNGDYSYGMYLFAFPMQQLYTTLFPDARVWYLNAAFAIVLSLGYAMFSWHMVEKPVLSNKKRIVGAVDAAVTGASRWASAFRPTSDRQTD